MKNRKDFHIPADPMRKGALVRTREMSPFVLHRVQVQNVVRNQNGERLVVADGREWRVDQLEVIRPPIG